MRRLCMLVVLAGASAAAAQDGAAVLLVVNRGSNFSRHIAEYYTSKRGIPAANVCTLNIKPEVEEISWDDYVDQVERPIARCLAKAKLQEQVLYIATTAGVPLKVTGNGTEMAAEACAVDSELALLYSKMKGKQFRRPGLISNPYYRHKDEAFTHPRFPMYLVTRLAGYDFEDVKGMIDRSLAAVNRGKFVFDLRSSDDSAGNNWLRTAALALPAERVVLEESAKVLTGEKDVIGYAGWGSNDPNRHQRNLGFQWLPGAIACEYVSTDGRTFRRPPQNWTIGTWQDPSHWFDGSPQTLTADYIHEGATGCSGHVYEPYLEFNPHPDQLFPAYFHGRNLAESYYAAIPGLSWQNIVVGDPLCRLK